MKAKIFTLLSGFLFAGVLLMGCNSDSSDSTAYVRLTNETGSTMSNISGGGATWIGPYADGTTTEQKEMDTGNVDISWTCGGSDYSMNADVEEGHWRIILYDCAAVSTSVIEE